MPAAFSDRCHGFTLVETLLAVSLLTMMVLTMGTVMVLAARASQSGAATDMAAVLAAQKLEQLRALTWGFDVSGTPSSDVSTNLASSPEQPAGGPGLSLSAADALQRNVEGFSDFLDARGTVLADGMLPPATVYVRRWSVRPLDGLENGIVLQVLVTRWKSRGASDTDASDRAARRLPDEARIVSIKMRKGT
jgi:type II secretory pathway pseudopilin PulG